MEPVVFIHGYSAESKTDSAADIATSYGSLPQAVRDALGSNVVQEIDLSRYVSLENGITVDDISRALNRALNEDFQHLLVSGFNVIIHSTGALVIRNWIRRFSDKPSVVRKVIYLAGANFGSGWAHIGKGQMAQWASKVFQNGTERGVQVLDALEFGSDWTLDLHLHFLEQGQSMAADYDVHEHAVVGTQADVAWYEIPIRYAKEDGSDGVVRASACNLNYNYLKFTPTDEARALGWAAAKAELESHRDREKDDRPARYHVSTSSQPGAAGRPVIPFAIPFTCAHSGDDMGVVNGVKPRAQVLRLILDALNATAGAWQSLVAVFDQETANSYDQVLATASPPWWKKWITEPRAQYDHHAQVIFRLRDQDGRPVKHFDVFFDSVRDRKDKSLPVRALMEDSHVNDVSPNIILFYLRTDAFDKKTRSWVPRVPLVNGCFLEISATEPETADILYLPMRFEFTNEQLIQWISKDRTTIIDVELLRLPSPNVFRMVKAT